MSDFLFFLKEVPAGLMEGFSKATPATAGHESSKFSLREAQEDSL